MNTAHLVAIVEAFGVGEIVEWTERQLGFIYTAPTHTLVAAATTTTRTSVVTGFSNSSADIYAST